MLEKEYYYTVLQYKDDFVKEVRKTFKPRDLVNASNTASGLQRVLSGIGRGLTGIIGFNIASINGLITSRLGYDRIKDLAGEKAAKKLISEGDTKEGGFQLLRVYRGLPKNKALIKFLSQEGIKQLLQKTENFYMQDQNKEMHLIDEELFFVIDENIRLIFLQILY